MFSNILYANVLGKEQVIGFNLFLIHSDNLCLNQQVYIIYKYILYIVYKHS